MTIERSDRVTQLQREGAKPIETLVLPDWVAQHVAGGVSRYELLTQFVQRAAIVIGDSYNVALGPAHARYFFAWDDGLAVPD